MFYINVNILKYLKKEIYKIKDTNTIISIISSSCDDSIYITTDSLDKLNLGYCEVCDRFDEVILYGKKEDLLNKIDLFILTLKYDPILNNY